MPHMVSKAGRVAAIYFERARWVRSRRETLAKDHVGVVPVSYGSAPGHSVKVDECLVGAKPRTVGQLETCIGNR